MDKKISSYMMKVRDYYRFKEGYEGMMDTDEVVKRVIRYSGDTSGEMGDSSGSDTDGLQKHREAANELWRVESERPITSHRRIIGRVIVFGKKVLRKLSRWYINPIVEQQNRFNAEITGALNELCNKIIVFEKSIEELRADICDTNERINDMKNVYNQRLEEASNQLQDLKNRYQSDYSYLLYRLQQAQETFATRKEGAPSSAPAAKTEQKNTEADTNAHIDYFLFENRFRGTEEEIKSNLSQYLKYFQQDNVLDIGCGRGEFLELLSENNIKAKGVDIYKDFALYCQNKGLDAVHGDAVDYLRGLEENSLGGIFLGQVIEHLSQEYLITLIDLAWKKLKPGAWFVAETPNPTMLSTFTNSFYLDMSHVKPVHPETMRFLLSYYGFKEIDILYSPNSKIPYDLPLLEGDSSIRNLEEFNNGINLLNGLIFGYQDYAIAGRK